MSGLGRSRVYQIHVRFGSKSALIRPILRVTVGICQDSCTRRGWIRVLLLWKVSCSYALCLLCNVHGHSSQPVTWIVYVDVRHIVKAAVA